MSGTHEAVVSTPVNARQHRTGCSVEGRSARPQSAPRANKGLPLPSTNGPFPGKQSAHICGPSANRLMRNGYAFDTSKIALGLSPISLFVTRGQLEFEWKHFCRKLSVRDPARHRSLTAARLRSHPMLRVIPGGVEPWEVV